MINFRKFLKDVTLLTLIKTVGGLMSAALVAFFTSDLLIAYYAQMVSYRYAMAALIFVALLILAFFILKSSDNQPAHPPVQSDFKVLSRTIEYVVVSATETSYIRKYKLKAKRDGLDRFVDRWNWTGDGDVSMQSLVKGHSLVHYDRNGIWNIFDVRFNRVLNESDEVDIWVQWNIENIMKKPSPFCSATISEPADELRFNIKFNNSSGISECLLEHMHSMSSREVIATSAYKVEKDVVDIVVKNPKLLHHYQVRWDWS